MHEARRQKEVNNFKSLACCSPTFLFTFAAKLSLSLALLFFVFWCHVCWIDLCFFLLLADARMHLSILSKHCFAGAPPPAVLHYWRLGVGYQLLVLPSSGVLPSSSFRPSLKD